MFHKSNDVVMYVKEYDLNQFALHFCQSFTQIVVKDTEKKITKPTGVNQDRGTTTGFNYSHGIDNNKSKSNTTMFVKAPLLSLMVTVELTSWMMWFIESLTDVAYHRKPKSPIKSIKTYYSCNTNTGSFDRILFKCLFIFLCHFFVFSLC